MPFNSTTDAFELHPDIHSLVWNGPQFMKDFMREFTKPGRPGAGRFGTPGGPGGGFPGGGPFGQGGFPGGRSQREWDEVVRDIFGAMNGGSNGRGGSSSSSSSSSSRARAGGGERVTVQEEIYTRSDGLRIVRRTVTTISPDGSARRDVTERVVGEGGPFGSGGGERRGRAPPPPGSGGHGGGYDPTAGGATRGAADAMNPLSQMGGVAGQVAKAFAAQMASRVARRGVEVILQAIMRSVFRR